MEGEELTGIFERRWNSDLKPAVEGAEICDAEEAKRRLANNQIKYFDPTQEHRTFRLQGMELVAQVQQAKGKSLLTQLWRVKSSDEYPKTLFCELCIRGRARRVSLDRQLSWLEK